MANQLPEATVPPASPQARVSAEPATPLGSASAAARTFYIRPDGGDSEECTGQSDAAYPGSGSGQACAWDHPFRALPPLGQPRIRGGDTLVVATGAYKMGFGAAGAEACEEGASYDCLMAPVPSGPDAEHPTRILGAGWDSGCAEPPELWGSGRPWFILNVTDTSNVVLSCFEITDHSSCVEDHTGGLACERDTPPYGDWASFGLYAEDSSDVTLRDLNIHGLAAGGVHAGRLSDWTVEGVRIAGNGSVGWDGDLWDDEGDSDSGSLVFRRWLVEWNGCGETWPEGEPIGCWGQEAGGYGDGVGKGATGGDWLIEDSAFLHNTSDGLDLLYHSLGGRIVLNRVRAEGNAGNQVKVTGQAEITNSVLVGNCAFFENQPFTYWVDHCRALGNSLAVFFTGGEQVSILNTTITGQGDGLIVSGPRDEASTCTGDERVVARNSIFLGGADYSDPADVTFLFYQEGCGGLQLDSDYNLLYNVKDVDCGATGDFTASGEGDHCRDPLLAGPFAGLQYGMTPASGSPAIDAGDDGVCPTVDIRGEPRPKDGDGDGRDACDIGAYEVP